ncbi:glycosyltransferase [Salinimicrobium sp. TH3]|uniref:glycosyltransferase n=1 Tax=Salinimicrobium sp. TH3 TaxID=2997342 RepID=UPI002273DF2C|nr:glycosyltransferase family 2 protein [Salinimicrobium sp. TH3]MCY2687799.1 glycosyltransferase family 2 protein [Salinimicrobium sp. TH3]
MKERMSKIGVVILNYNSYQDTISLVENIQLQTVAQNIYIIIVDNNSPNGSFEELFKYKLKYSNVEVLQTGANLGYAKGNNFGLKYLEKNIHPDYVAILNNDIILPNNCFEKLIDKYSTLENPAIIAPMERSPNGNAAILGPLRSFWEDILSLSMLHRVLNKKKPVIVDNTNNQAMKVEVIGGSFMFSDFKRFKQLGYFYPKTFLYVEERFVAHAVKQQGFNNYVLLEESYIHDHSATINSFHNTYSKYKLWHNGLIEYTLVCRKYGRLKAGLLRILMTLSLLEIKTVHRIKGAFN